jgi:hypothetical protein
VADAKRKIRRKHGRHVFCSPQYIFSGLLGEVYPRKIAEFVYAVSPPMPSHPNMKAMAEESLSNDLIGLLTAFLDSNNPLQ